MDPDWEDEEDELESPAMAGSCLRRRFPPHVREHRTTVELFAALRSGEIDLNASYQRKFVWTQENSQSFIDSVLRNAPVNQVMFSKAGGSLRCVDGKQRLTSLMKFMGGEISFPNPDDNKSYWWTDNRVVGTGKHRLRLLLPPADRAYFEAARLSCIVFDELSPEEERDIFERVQRGRPLKAAEVLRAIEKPRSVLVTTLEARFFDNENSPLSKSLFRNLAHAAPFRCLAHLAAAVATGSLTTHISKAALEKWLKDGAADIGPLEREMQETMEVLEAMHAQPIVPPNTESALHHLAPVEFVACGSLVQRYRNVATLEALTMATRRMRENARLLYPREMKVNSSVLGTMNGFMAGWAMSEESRTNPGDIPAMEIMRRAKQELNGDGDMQRMEQDPPPGPTPTNGMDPGPSTAGVKRTWGKVEEEDAAALLVKREPNTDGLPAQANASAMPVQPTKRVKKEEEEEIVILDALPSTLPTRPSQPLPLPVPRPPQRHPLPQRTHVSQSSAANGSAQTQAIANVTLRNSNHHPPPQSSTTNKFPSGPTPLRARQPSSSTASSSQTPHTHANAQRPMSASTQQRPPQPLPTTASSSSQNPTPQRPPMQAQIQPKVNTVGEGRPEAVVQSWNLSYPYSRTHVAQSPATASTSQSNSNSSSNSHPQAPQQSHVQPRPQPIRPMPSSSGSLPAQTTRPAPTASPHQRPPPAVSLQPRPPPTASLQPRPSSAGAQHPSGTVPQNGVARPAANAALSVTANMQMLRNLSEQQQEPRRPPPAQPQQQINQQQALARTAANGVPARPPSSTATSGHVQPQALAPRPSSVVTTRPNVSSSAPQQSSQPLLTSAPLPRRPTSSHSQIVPVPYPLPPQQEPAKTTQIQGLERDFLEAFFKLPLAQQPQHLGTLPMEAQARVLEKMDPQNVPGCFHYVLPQNRSQIFVRLPLRTMGSILRWLPSNQAYELFIALSLTEQQRLFVGLTVELRAYIVSQLTYLLARPLFKHLSVEQKNEVFALIPEHRQRLMEEQNRLNDLARKREMEMAATRVAAAVQPDAGPATTTFAATRWAEPQAPAAMQQRASVSPLFAHATPSTVQAGTNSAPAPNRTPPAIQQKVSVSPLPTPASLRDASFARRSIDASLPSRNQTPTPVSVPVPLDALATPSNAPTTPVPPPPPPLEATFDAPSSSEDVEVIDVDAGEPAGIYFTPTTSLNAGPDLEQANSVPSTAAPTSSSVIAAPLPPPPPRPSSTSTATSASTSTSPRKNVIKGKKGRGPPGQREPEIPV